jgi:CHAT domain-containing protein
MTTHVQTPPNFGLLLGSTPDHADPTAFGHKTVKELTPEGREPSLESEPFLQTIIHNNYLGHFTEAIAACKRELKKPDGPPAHRWRAWLELAVAHTHTGHLAEARVALVEATGIKDPDDTLREAHNKRVMGLVESYSNNYSLAIEYLATAHQDFEASSMAVEAARCKREMGLAMLAVDPPRALQLLEEIKPVFSESQLLLDLALTDYCLAVVQQRLNQYQKALELQRLCTSTFLEYGAPYFHALGQVEIGILLCRLNNYAEAEQNLIGARDFFAEHQVLSEAIRCDINLAWLYDQTNRPMEAEPLLQKAARHSLESGRPVRAARCFENLALIYQQQGQYDKSLHALLRARHVFNEQEARDDVAACDEYLAGTYLGLSMFGAAENAFIRTRIYYEQAHLSVNLARCETRLGELYLSQTKWEQARDLLEHARGLYETNHLTVQTAECDRLLAEVLARCRQLSEAWAHAVQARTIFERKHFVIQVALCDLLQGDLCLAEEDTDRAQSYFESACGVLEPLMPDNAWRAREGLGRCALRRDEKQHALAHFVQGVHFIQRVRATLPSERLSAAYFHGRNGLFEAAFLLAMELEEYEEALNMCESAKTATFPLFLQNRARPFNDTQKADSHVVSLIVRETEARRELAELHAQLDVTNQLVEREQAVDRNAHADLLHRLNTLHQSHEELVEQLRLAASSEWRQHTAGQFSLSTFRKAMGQRLGTRWLCLTYHFVGESLYIFSITPSRLLCHIQPLTPTDQFILRQCAANSPTGCRLVHGSTLGTSYMRLLYQLLIPQAVRESLHELDLLVIIPSERLHGLAFQALLDDSVYLIERVPLTYAPSLQSLQVLIGEAGAAPGTSRAFLCGLDDFQQRAAPLPHAKAEIESLERLFGKEAQSVWGEAATAGAIRQLSQQGDLSACGLIHFATHSVMDTSSPLQSRILLYNSELTIADILDLRLESALVTLSSCQGASGTADSGEELLNLARAFFYAGAQTLVASLWPVEDRETQYLMMQFYQHLLQHHSPARALQRAQIELLQAGALPYQWAAFSVIGQP